jgi:DNA-binding MarR family transcriptional regulator
MALEQFLPFRLSLVSYRIGQALARVCCRQFSLTAPDWRVLVFLQRRGPAGAGDVMESAALDKVAMSRSVRQLRRLNYVQRQVDPGDQRRMILELTPAGQEVSSRIASLALAFEAELFADVAHHRDTLHWILGRLEVHPILEGRRRKAAIGGEPPPREEAGEPDRRPRERRPRGPGVRSPARAKKNRPRNA